MKEDVYPVRRYYRVFNGDVIDGIPEREKREFDSNGKAERLSVARKARSTK